MTIIWTIENEITGERREIPFHNTAEDELNDGDEVVLVTTDGVVTYRNMSMKEF